MDKRAHILTILRNLQAQHPKGDINHSADLIIALFEENKPTVEASEQTLKDDDVSIAIEAGFKKKKEQ